LIPVHRSTPQETHLPQRLSLPLADSPVDKHEPDGVRLTPRQLEVLALLCEGLPNKLICRQLSISAGTVKAHISGILRELAVTSRLQAVVTARRLGLDCAKPDSAAEPPRLAGSARTASTVTAVDFAQRIAHRMNLGQQGR
jgi:DNA-binding CsgD family transcriptional regulator